MAAFAMGEEKKPGCGKFTGTSTRRAVCSPVRLMPAQCVKPYVKTNKNDYIDAEAIAEAVQRPRMRFVPMRLGPSAICRYAVPECPYPASHNM
jgi:hypothetical protein